MVRIETATYIEKIHQDRTPKTYLRAEVVMTTAIQLMQAALLRWRRAILTLLRTELQHFCQTPRHATVLLLAARLNLAPHTFPPAHLFFVLD